MAYRRLKRFGQSGILYFLSFVLSLGFPLAVYADDASVTPVTQAPSSTSVSSPESTSTSQTSPTSTTTPTSSQQSTSTPTSTTPTRTYTYDTETNRWNTDEWQYDKQTGTYVAVPKTSTQSTSSSSPATTSTGTSPASTSTTTVDSKNQTTPAVASALESLAQTGDANVLQNTTAGNASSGDAAATAMIINNVNSIVTNSNNTEAATFVSDVMGDVNGDIMLQPMLLKAMLEAGAANQTSQTVNKTNIQNDLNLAAISGDATVAKNTTAGSAMTGSAHTVADVANIVNSMIAANQSFIGTVNIYGNLNGDILIAPDFIPQMIANNKELQKQATENTTVDSRDTQSIVNNVKLAAESGQAVVTGNTAAGSAMTGNADTNLVIFNLTGHEVVAHDSLLVFVNVLGKWVGAIVDAPTGATAAAIGSGITSKQEIAPNMVIDINNDVQIVNNINLASQSGDALVASNTRAGNATSGNATSSANILNMTNSQLGLSGWFGILFINVYGSWTGSFGVDTAAGTKVFVRQSDSAGAGRAYKKVIEFIPRFPSMRQPVTTTYISPQSGVTRTTGASSTFVSQSRSHRGTDNTAPNNNILGVSESPSPSRQPDIAVMVGSLVLIVLSAYGVRRFLL